MATRTWTGETDGDWGTTTNWEDDTVPISGDDVYIVSGSVDIDGSDQSAVTLDSLTVGPKYTGTIGTSGTKLQVSATNFIFSGAGSTNYFEGSYANLTIQNTSTDSDALNIYGDSDEISKLRILGGRGGVNIDSSCDLGSSSTVEQIGASGVTTTIADGTTIHGTCTLKIDSGKMVLNQAIADITVFGGDLEVGLDSGTVTTLEQYGGRVRWNPSAACTITTLNIFAGLFDSSDSTAPAFTITNTTLHEGGSINERSGLENATWTNPINMEGGEVIYDSGRQVTIS